MLDERKEIAISALIIGNGPSEASRKANVSRGTIYSWLENKEFKDELEKRRKLIVTEGNNYIIANNQSHLEVIHNLAVSTSDKRTALAAACYLVDRAMGKVATKIALDNDDNNKDSVPTDVLAAEIREWENEE